MKLTVIETGFFKLDGGAMFGVVPKRMWSKLNPPDEHNMCSWALRTLLVEVGDRKILFDTGLGNKQDAKWRTFFEPHGEATLFGSLAKAGVQPEEITDVFLTHLHFDHCGGALFRDDADGGLVKLAFPNAIYWSNQRHFDWAMRPNAREKASFLPENIVPLHQSGKLRFLDIRQNIEFAPGIRVRFVNGHTEAMMVPQLRTERGTVVYCADLLPSQWHIGLPYVMAYDIRPLVSIKEKEKLLTEAVQKRQTLLLEHDPATEACTLRRDEAGRIVLDRTGKLGDWGS